MFPGKKSSPTQIALTPGTRLGPYAQIGVGGMGEEVYRAAGNSLLYGPEVTNRAQPHRTFTLLVFNGIYYGTGDEVVLNGRAPTEGLHS